MTSGSERQPTLHPTILVRRACMRGDFCAWCASTLTLAEVANLQAPPLLSLSLSLPLPPHSPCALPTSPPCSTRKQNYMMNFARQTGARHYYSRKKRALLQRA